MDNLELDTARANSAALAAQEDTGRPVSLDFHRGRYEWRADFDGARFEYPGDGLAVALADMSNWAAERLDVRV